MEKCKACSDYFEWDDEVIEVDDEYYHKDCVALYPTVYVAFLNGDCLGETENADGTMAYSIFDDGQYIDDID